MKIIFNETQMKKRQHIKYLIIAAIDMQLLIIFNVDEKENNIADTT